ncbi:hypothetical protein IMZ48_32755 [Candidatus Bathyarchaeota archaeon]|nr:hypothetical protein [Candidatus Bathyarchaeota archaeon]
MQQRIAAFEKLFMAGAMNGAINPLQQPPPMSYPPTAANQQQYMSPSQRAAAEAAPAGMIHVPEEMKRILRAQPAQPYPVQETYGAGSRQQAQVPQNRWRGAAPYTGKLMVGSLAGLM